MATQDAFGPLSLGDTLRLCRNGSSAGRRIYSGPLRCMVRTEDGSSCEVIPYLPGKVYVGISYSWPHEDFARLYNSKDKTPVGKDTLSRNVSGFVFQCM